MRISRRQLGFFFVVLLAVIVGGLFISHGVLAQDFGTGYLAGSDLPQDDVRVVIVRVINVVLGVLGVVFVGLMIYAGWLWMTAGGNEQQVGKARKIIINAVIGLIIIFMAFAFTRFIFNLLNDAGSTPGGPTSCTDGSVSGCNVCVGGIWAYDSTLCMLPGSSFRIRDVSTAHGGTDNAKDVYLCSAIQANTNNRIDSATVSGNVTLTNGGSTVTATISNTSRSIEIVPDAKLNKNTVYKARYAKALSDTTGLSLSGCDPFNCSDAGTAFEWQFETGETDDLVKPEITNTSPISDLASSRYPDQNVARDGSIRVTFSENIRASSIDDGSGSPTTGNFILEVLDGAGGSVVTTIPNTSLDVVTRGDGFDVYWQPPALFEPFTWYRVTVQGITDLCGNQMVAPVTWEFETNDRSPGIGSAYPTGTNVCPDVSAMAVTFKTSMERDVVSIAISKDAAGNPPIMSAAFRSSDLAPGPYYISGTGGVWAVDPASNFTAFTFTPDASLETNTQYFVQITTDRVMDTSGALLTYAWDFEVSDAESCACSPYISSIRPGQGLKGQCVTITGQCFKGSVYDDPADLRHAEPTQLLFNTTPGTIGGSDRKYITSSIPTSVNKGDHIVPNITISYNDSALGSITSNNTSVEYYVDSEDTALGPCLFELDPSQACTEEKINLSGVRLGTDPGAGNRATTQNNVSMNNGGLVVADSLVTGWTDDEVNMSVPLTATDGNVAITVAGQQSNSIPFDLMCSVGASCDSDPSTAVCTDNGACGNGLYCESSTCTCQRVVTIDPELPVVVDKFPTCSLSCTNALIGAEFNHDIDPGTLSDVTVDVYPCGTDCSRANLGSEIVYDGGVDYDPANRIFTVNPLVDLNTNTSYRVVLSGDIARPTGETLAGLNYDVDNDGTDDSYSWTFATKDGPCEITSVDVLPASTSADRLNQKVRFTAYPGGSTAQCGSQKIDASAYDWTWNSSDITIASISTDDADNDTFVDAKQFAIVVGEGLTTITAEAQGQSDTAELKVDIITCNETTDCEKEDPNTGVKACPNSVCDQTTKTCTPVVTSLSPASGPLTQWTTVQGCYFGSVQGDGGVFFGSTEAVYPACGGGVWRNNSIIVEVPSTLSTGTSYPVTVVTDSSRGLTSNAANFNVTNQCTNTPVPGICYVIPSRGAIESTVGISGVRFGTTEDTVLFEGPSSRVSADIIAGSWEDENIQASVPVSAITGDITVSVNSCVSNGVAYEVTTGLGSPCDSNTGTAQCDPSDRMCGSGTTGLACDPTSCTCKVPDAPTVVWRSPYGASANACRNTIAQVVFDQAMNSSTVTSTVVYLTNSAGDRVTDARVRHYTITSMTDTRVLGTPSTSTVTDYAVEKDRTVVEIIPGKPLVGNATYTIHVSTQAQSVYGRNILAEDVTSFNTKNEICRIDHVDVTINTDTTPSSRDYFMCAGRDDCEGDIAPGSSGNQHAWYAQAYDASEPPQGLSADYEWKEDTVSNLYSLAGGTSYSQPAIMLTALPNNGDSSFTVTASDTDAGSAKAYMSVETFLCENPWPSLATFPYHETNTDFTTFYCRDRGTGNVCLNGSATVARSCSDDAQCGSGGSCVLGSCENDNGNAIVSCSVSSDCNGDGTTNYMCGADTSDDLTSLGTPVSQKPASGPVEREVFFFPADYDDAIAIQVYKNEDFLNPAVWYAQNVPNPGSPQSIIIDGYPAVRDGRTVYVSAAYNRGGSYTAYMYLMSYNQNAASDVVEIYDQLLDNWRFTTNLVAPEQKIAIRRDTQRITDLGGIKRLLQNYKEDHGTFPLLESGTFVTGQSTSKWPSWDGEMRSLLGASLPKDPLDIFSECPASGISNPERFEQSSCWNKTDKVFSCADNSYIYQYIVTSGGSSATLYGNLELDGVSWGITGLANDNTDTCKSLKITTN